MENWQDWVGRQQAQQDVLTPGLINRFCATIDSDGDCRVAPQGIHWCLCLPDAPTSTLGVDGHPPKGGFLPAILLPRRMWASSAVEFVTPIAAGAALSRTSTIASVTEKQGSTGSLVFVEIDHETWADAALAVRERQTIVYRDASTAAPAPAPEQRAPDLSSWQWHRVITPSEAMLFRYSALSFNTHRIHYDQHYAVAEERYRGLVVHGPLTATLLLDLARRHLGDHALTHFAFRGQSPAFANEPLHLVGRVEGSAVTLAALGGDGRTVMSADAAL